MCALHDYFSRIDRFKRQAKNILSKHEASTSRVITIENSYESLEELDVKQNDLIKQALRCIEHKLFKASHVLAWAGMADYLEVWLISDPKSNLELRYPKWNISSIVTLRESTNEFQVITALRKCEIIAKDEEHALQGLLKRRNMCAHPTDYLPDLNMTLGFIAEIIHWFSVFEKKQTRI